MLEASDEYEVKLTVATRDREECIISASNISEPYTFQGENVSANGDILISFFLYFIWHHDDVMWWHCNIFLHLVMSRNLWQQ